MSLDTMLAGRIATFSGQEGFGWVEAIGIENGRVLVTGAQSGVASYSDSSTKVINLRPDEIAIPGLTDAHLHLAHTAMAMRHVDLSTSPSIEDGLAKLGKAHQRLGDPDTWLEGYGWDSDRWGRWPTGDDLERAAPGRRAAIWAHDHHALWASHAALRASDVHADTQDPPGGIIRRNSSGNLDGVLHEAAASLVARHIPPPKVSDLEAEIVNVGRQLLALGIVACHDPGWPDLGLENMVPAYARLSDTWRLPIHVHASLRPDSIPAAAELGMRSGQPLGGDPEGRARLGWQKCFADGTLGSRTAAMLADFTPEPDRPIAPEHRRGVWITEPDALRLHAETAAAEGIATQIHAIGDAAVRAALDALISTASVVPLMPRVEHVQLLDRADRARFARNGIAASVQPIHLGSDAAQARKVWGERAEENGYPLASLANTGAVLAFGTDAPIESFDPWPGIVLAVCRQDRRWPSETPPFGPWEELSLERALRASCIDAAVSAHETDRGRLIKGQRADVVVIPSDVLDEPVVPGGALANARPTLVLMDGQVVFQAD